MSNNSKSPSNLGNLLALTTALAGILLSSYGGRSVYAGSCVGAAGTYACSGVADATDTAQNLAFGGALTVTTSAGFGIDTSVTGGTAIVMDNAGGSGDLTFTDANSAAITGAATGLAAINAGDNALNISTTGAVTGNNGYGIYANNVDDSTDLTINAQGSVSGNSAAIFAINRSKYNGSTSITTSYSVSSATGAGIIAVNRGETENLTINVNSSVSAYGSAITVAG